MSTSIEVTQSAITLTDGRTRQQFFINQIRKVSTYSRTYQHRQEDPKDLKAAVKFLALVCVIMTLISLAEPGFLIGTILSGALIVAAIMELKKAKYKYQEFKLYFAVFVSGNDEQQNLTSRSPNEIEEFAEKVNLAISGTLKANYTVNISNHLQGQEINIENFATNDQSSVQFFEGDAPKEAS